MVRYGVKSIQELEIDWEGYTIGYYGRIFEAKGRVKVHR
jgi:hypothetical protein